MLLWLAIMAIARYPRTADKADSSAPSVPTSRGPFLDYNQHAYRMLQGVRTKWPCLSIEALPLKCTRTEYPLTVYLVAGTQARRPQDNRLVVMKVSGIQPMEAAAERQRRVLDRIVLPDSGGVVQLATLVHQGAINRLRVCWAHQQCYHH